MSRSRIPFRFERKFSANSERGKLFDWLQENYDSSTSDMILCAVKVLFQPQALAELGESEEVVKKAVRRSRRIFEEKMMAALEPFLNGDSPVDLTNFQKQANGSSLRVLPAISGANEPRVNITAASSQESSVDELDEFELDESKIFDDNNHFGGIQ